MEIKGREVDFPGINQISFKKIFELLENQVTDDDKSVATHAKSLLKELEAYPELREGFRDYSLLEKYKDPIKKLCRTFFPDLLLTNEIKAVTPPYDFQPFHMSTRLQNILANSGDDFKFEMEDFDTDLFYKFAGAAVMGMHYGFAVDLGKAFTMEIPNVKTGINRSYRIAFNADLMEIIPTDRSIEITEEDYHRLISNWDDMDLWREKFPPDSWIFSGIGIMNMIDVTADASIAKLTSNLLSTALDTFEKIKDNLRALFNIKDLTIGYAGYENQTFFKDPKEIMPSILVGNDRTIRCEDALCHRAMETLIENQQAMAITDTEYYNDNASSELGKHLVEQKVGSYIIVPMVHQDKFLGFIELASPRKYELSNASLTKLVDVLPILAMAANRFQEEAKNRIEAIIQEECTTIHPSVKWRFEEEAEKYMIANEMKQEAHFRDIVFKDVFPLYGQMDIKGSSTQRNEAVIEDIISQLKAVHRVIDGAYKEKNLPLYEEILFRLDAYKREMKDGLSAGSEHKILGFLKSEVYPVFEHLKTGSKIVQKLVEDYYNSMDEELGIIYKARKKFDTSVMRSNQMMANFMDKKQEEAQKMFPHYFERYKTDGLEYNLYIGQSIVKDRSFDEMYLRNLRLWQLLIMCEMENEFHRLQPDLNTKLEVASLILVYSTPLAIHFRMDEKRFDVEGAYNARYEIVKKRVDKANIKDTNERITQPGKIAVIYTSDQDKAEYMRYIDFLTSKGYLVPGSAADLEVENLQGITGLRALRVDVSYDDQPKELDGVTFEELVKVIKE